MLFILKFAETDLKPALFFSRITYIFDSNGKNIVVILITNFIMEVCQMKNSSIQCTVTQCKHNDCKEHYCTLSTIRVGTHENNPTMVECTDCESFELK